MKVICGTSNPELSNEIVRLLNINSTKTKIKKFSDGEIYVKIEEEVRGEDVFIVQSTNSNNNLVELLIIIDAVKRASAQRITAVIPYFGYARQDRKSEAREPITAKLVANLITVAGANRVLTIDLHSPQIQGFFDIPLDDTWAFPLFVKYLKNHKIDNPVIVSPDAGGVKRAMHFSKRIKAPIAMIDKRRKEHNEIDEMIVVGEVKGKTAILYDDMIDTGGTICKAAHAVMEAGAKEVLICATHPLFSGDAIDKLIASDAKEIIVTNSVPAKKNKKITFVDMAPILAKAIRNIHENKSVSTLHDQILE